MEKFNISKWKNKYILKEETTSADLAKTFKKPISSFTQDLEKYLNDPKVKAILNAGEDGRS
jgi:hypothetical protein